MPAVAVTSAVAPSTDTAGAVAADSDTVIVAVVVVPVPPSVTVAALIEIAGVGASSSRIVPVADACASVALTAPDSAMVNVSSGSNTTSPTADTVIVAVVAPGAKLTVPAFTA